VAASTDAGAAITHVHVGRVAPRNDVPVTAKRFHGGTALIQQRPNYLQSTLFAARLMGRGKQHAPGRNAGQAVHAGATQHAQQHGLGLIVARVAGRDNLGAQIGGGLPQKTRTERGAPPR
jgi:hypothetical protein